MNKSIDFDIITRADDKVINLLNKFIITNLNLIIFDYCAEITQVKYSISKRDKFSSYLYISGYLFCVYQSIHHGVKKNIFIINDNFKIIVYMNGNFCRKDYYLCEMFLNAFLRHHESNLLLNEDKKISDVHTEYKVIDYRVNLYKKCQRRNNVDLLDNYEYYSDSEFGDFLIGIRNPLELLKILEILACSLKKITHLSIQEKALLY